MEAIDLCNNVSATCNFDGCNDNNGMLIVQLFGDSNCNCSMRIVGVGLRRVALVCIAARRSTAQPSADAAKRSITIPSGMRSSQ